MAIFKPHDSHRQKMTPALQAVIDAADKRKRDKSAMPADCTSPTGCRAHGCHGACIPGDPDQLDRAANLKADSGSEE